MTLVPEMLARVLAVLLVSMAAVPAMAQERGAETLVPETLVPETLVPETPVPETPVPETPVPATAGPESAVWDLERAFVEMERLQAEVAVLKGIARAQAALLAWNRQRAETLGPNSGAGPAVLSARLCAEPGLEIWCRVLPATFGAGAAEAAGDGQGKDGER